MDKWTALRKSIKQKMHPLEENIKNERLPANIRRNAEDELYTLSGVLKTMDIFDSYEEADKNGTRGQ